MPGATTTAQNHAGLCRHCNPPGVKLPMHSGSTILDGFRPRTLPSLPKLIDAQPKVLAGSWSGPSLQHIQYLTALPAVNPLR